VGEVSRFLERARERMPADAPKEERARFFHLRGAMRAGMGDKAGAQRDFEAAQSVWPARDNPAAQALEELRRP
jgi:lipoprotein NlpI